MSSIHIDIHDAEVTDWVSYGLIAVILIARIGLNIYHTGRPGLTAYLAFASLIIITVRVSINHYILSWRTITDYSKRYGESIHQPELHQAQTGSILSLVARFLITTYYWLQSVLCLLLYRRLVEHIAWVRTAVWICWAVMALTWVATTLTTFLECQPFSLYYQLPHSVDQLPSCVRAYGQLLTQCVSNIVIDILLLIISFPILQVQITNYPRNIQLGVIYLLGTFCIIVTCIRISNTYRRDSTQYVRSFWASVQALVATFVANGPPIYAALIVLFRSGFGLPQESDHSWEVGGGTQAHEKEKEKESWLKGEETIRLKSMIGPEDRDYNFAVPDGGERGATPSEHHEHHASGALPEEEHAGLIEGGNSPVGTHAADEKV